MTLRKSAASLLVVALTLGLIGAGLSASYSDSVSAQQNVSVGTFGIELSTAVPGAVVSPDKHSVTFAGPEIQSSAAGSLAFPFTVKSIGNIPVTVKLTQTVPVAPFTSALIAPVADVVLNQNETHDYAGGLAWPMLVNADLSKAVTITYTASVVEGPGTVAAAAPTVQLRSADGLTPGGINVPAVQFLTYSIAGTPVSSGFNARANGAYQVTAAPDALHQMTNYPAGGWNKVVADAANARPVTITSATAYAWINDLYGSRFYLSPASVITGQTVTYVIPVNTASTPSYPGGSGGQPIIGSYSVTLPSGGTLNVLASATVSASLTSQASKFSLVYRNQIFGVNYASLGALNKSNVNLTNLGANRHNGGGNGTDNMPGVTWAGVTGTGTVTIVLSFSATTP